LKEKKKKKKKKENIKGDNFRKALMGYVSRMKSMDGYDQ
jgi:hypothetical protein